MPALVIRLSSCSVATRSSPCTVESLAFPCPSSGPFDDEERASRACRSALEMEEKAARTSLRSTRSSWVCAVSPCTSFVADSTSPSMSSAAVAAAAAVVLSEILRSTARLAARTADETSSAGPFRASAEGCCEQPANMPAAATRRVRRTVRSRGDLLMTASESRTHPEDSCPCNSVGRQQYSAQWLPLASTGRAGRCSSRVARRQLPL